MTNINKFLTEKKNYAFFSIIFFIISLIPFSIDIYSINYSFVLFPLASILLSGKINLPSKNILFFILFYFLIFFLGIIFNSGQFQYLDRRLASFLIFMSLFSFVFVKIDKKKIDAFKIAIVAIVLFIIIIKIGKFIFYTLEQVGNMKHYVGSSRFGFVYILAFWIIAFYKPENKSTYLFKYISIFLIFFGILITYSRSTVVSFFLSIGLFYLKYLLFTRNNFYYQIIFIIFILILSIILFFISKHTSPTMYYIYYENFFSYFSLEGILLLYERFSNIESSEGFRFYLFEKIMNYVLLNPLIGSGFLGCWIIFEDLICSAHNQYLDVIFRVGIFGMFIYTLFLLKIYKYLKRYHQDLFYGFIGIIIYGFFHETFKLSQGAFILSFLFGMTYVSKPINLLNQKQINKKKYSCKN